MNWADLLNEKRRKPKDTDETKFKIHLDDKRTQFERDYDRVIFTSSLRRLQDKAQVFPLEASDFVRTRLTHSIEVSTIGRSLALDVGRQLGERNTEGAPDPQAIATVVATACLLHDVGNPPFGHFGESAIREWFDDHADADWVKGLPREYCLDFSNFEGNAQALRILTRLQMHNHEYGVNLTVATLGSLIKYPCSSSEIDDRSKVKSKCGYFMSEREVFEEISKETGTGRSRHPLVYIMEAADDIAYSVIDIEDAVKKGVLTFNDVVTFLKNHLKDKTPDLHSDLFYDLQLHIDHLDGQTGWPDPDNVKIQQLRIMVHGLMIKACSDAFIEHYSDIMGGTLDNALIAVSKAQHLYRAFKKLAVDRVYKTKAVLTLEYLGKEVIHGLMDRFVPAVMSSKRNDSRTSAGKLYELISPTFRYIAEKEERRLKDKEMEKAQAGEARLSDSVIESYVRLQLVTDFICGMTDTYALDLYQRLTGVKI